MQIIRNWFDHPNIPKLTSQDHDGCCMQNRNAHFHGSLDLTFCCCLFEFSSLPLWFWICLSYPCNEVIYILELCLLRQGWRKGGHVHIASHFIVDLSHHHQVSILFNILMETKTPLQADKRYEIEKSIKSMNSIGVLWMQHGIILNWYVKFIPLFCLPH